MAASFLTIIQIINRDSAATVAALSSAFSADLMVYVTSNNRTALDQGIKALNSKTAAGKAIAAALAAAEIPGAGYIGARAGAFKNQPEDVRNGWMSVHAECVGRFTASLESSGLFEKKIRTEEQKAAGEKKTAEKKAAANKAAIDAFIAANDLVPRSTIMSEIALIDAIASGLFDATDIRLILDTAAAAYPDVVSVWVADNEAAAAARAAAAAAAADKAAADKAAAAAAAAAAADKAAADKAADAADKAAADTAVEAAKAAAAALRDAHPENIEAAKAAKAAAAKAAKAAKAAAAKAADMALAMM